jgi:general secretion pathway protein K
MKMSILIGDQTSRHGGQAEVRHGESVLRRIRDPAFARVRRGKQKSEIRFRIRGAALMLSLWALFLLSAMVISWALDIDSRLTLSGNANRVLEAEAMACSGAEVALHPNVKPDSPNLRRQIGERESYEAHITGEGGRLNLNWLVAGEDPARLEILRKYLENKGIDLNERDRMIDCLLDWVDPDNLVRLNGAEESEDYHPANALLTRIDQLKKVKGWLEFTSAPGWDNELTLNSGGPVDLSWASRDVLLSLPGLTEGVVDQFLQVRRGPDRIDGTADDAQFKSLEDVRAAFGLSPEQFKQLLPLVGFRDPVFRVVSVGKSGVAQRVVQMVVRKVGNRPQLITWKEF